VLRLVDRSLRRLLPLAAGLAAVLCAFEYALVAVAASYERAGKFGQLAAFVPDFAQGHIGKALTSFSAMTTSGYFEPAVVLIVAQFTIHVAAEPAAEIESGLVDVVIARPLPRHWLVSRALLVMIVSTLALLLLMGAATALGLALLAPRGARWPGASSILWISVNLALVAWCFGAATLAVAGWARRRASAQGTVAVACVAFYLISLVSGWWAPARPFARLTPFHYFTGAAIISGGGMLARNLSLLASAVVLFSGVAYWQFGRRDL
jgi:ABC-2 type transport system permease protein